MPGNHDIGDNPTEFGPPSEQPVTEENRQYFVSVIGEDRWSFDAAGWRFIGLNSMVMNSGLAYEAEQFDWLTSQLAATGSKPVALFLHKPLYLNTPDDPEFAATSFRYVPQPARRRLIELLDAVDLRLVHPSAPRLHPWSGQAHLGAVDGLHHSRREAGTARHQGGRAGGVSFRAPRF